MLLIGLILFKKNSKVFQKYCLHLTGKISSEQLSKVEEVEPFGHSGAPKKMKQCHTLTIFPVLGKLTHMGQFLQDEEKVQPMS